MSARGRAGVRRGEAYGASCSPALAASSCTLIPPGLTRCCGRYRQWSATCNIWPDAKNQYTRTIHVTLAGKWKLAHLSLSLSLSLFPWKWDVISNYQHHSIREWMTANKTTLCGWQEFVCCSILRCVRASWLLEGGGVLLNRSWPQLTKTPEQETWPHNTCRSLWWSHSRLRGISLGYYCLDLLSASPGLGVLQVWCYYAPTSS